MVLWEFTEVLKWYHILPFIVLKYTYNQPKIVQTFVFVCFLRLKSYLKSLWVGEAYAAYEHIS